MQELFILVNHLQSSMGVKLLHLVHFGNALDKVVIGLCLESRAEMTYNNKHSSFLICVSKINAFFSITNQRHCI